MLPVGSQADSAEKHLKLCLVPRFGRCENLTAAVRGFLRISMRDLFFLRRPRSRSSASDLPLLHIFANERAMMWLDLAGCHGYR
jgi:hypothetical protein